MNRIKRAAACSNCNLQSFGAYILAISYITDQAIDKSVFQASKFTYGV